SWSSADPVIQRDRATASGGDHLCQRSTAELRAQATQYHRLAHSAQTVGLWKGASSRCPVFEELAKQRSRARPCRSLTNPLPQGPGAKTPTSPFLVVVDWHCPRSSWAGQPPLAEPQDPSLERRLPFAVPDAHSPRCT